MVILGQREKENINVGPLWDWGIYRECLEIAVYWFYIVFVGESFQAFIGEVSSFLEGAGHYYCYWFQDFLVSVCVYFDLYYQYFISEYRLCFVLLGIFCLSG